MRPENIFHDLNLYQWLESLLPDFVLAFAFFTSVCYAVLGKRLDHQRAAIVMSVSIGLALSIGLVWWEQANELSIKNLGPIAIGFAILVLSFVMYQSIKQVGGIWAGAGIAIGACILIAQLLKLNIPVNSDIIQTITVVALMVGLIAFFSKTRNYSIRFPHVPNVLPGISDVRHDMADLHRDRHLSDKLSKTMRNLRKQANNLNEHPQNAGNVLVQLKRMLPAEGYLTERMAQLRAKAYRVREGHVARLEETRQVFANLPISAKKKASADLAGRYNQLIGIDTRLERLDRAVAENEHRIRDLTSQAQRYAAGYDLQKLNDALKAAQRLQHHNSRLFKIINRTESRLTGIAKKIAQDAKEVNRK